MEAHSTGSELPAFGQFIQTLHVKGHSMTADEAVVAFRKYQDQLVHLKKELQPAREELNAGCGAELDLRSIYESVKQQLAEEGITD